MISVTMVWYCKRQFTGKFFGMKFWPTFSHKHYTKKISDNIKIIWWLRSVWFIHSTANGVNNNIFDVTILHTCMHCYLLFFNFGIKQCNCY